MRSLIFLLALCSCIAHPVLRTSPDVEKAEAVVSVFTASNRDFETMETQSGRGDILRFGRLDVAIPPDRMPGKVAFPRGDNIDPEKHFLLADSATFSRQAFRAALSRSLRDLPADERDILLFVHGFNTSFAGGVFRMAQLTHDVGLKGVSVHFSWPSLAHPLAYARDRDSILFSRNDLVEVLKLIDVPEARRVGVIAHSMGAFLTMEAMRQMEIAEKGSVNRTIDGVVFLSPDIDVDVFRRQARLISPLPRPFAIFLSQKDRALGLSARLTGEKARLGNLSDPTVIQEFDIAVIDVSEFSSGGGHFDVGTSPALIGILARAAEVDSAFARDAGGLAGILPGSVLTIQNVTSFVLTPGGVRAR